MIEGIHVGIFIRSEGRYWGVRLRNQRKSEKGSVQKSVIIVGQGNTLAKGHRQIN